MVERDCHELLAPGFRVDFVTRLSYLAAWPSLEPRLLQVFILFFFAGPTDSPSQETGWWKTKHFMGKALRLGSLTVDSCSFSFSAESLTQEWLVSFFKDALRVREKETWAERWLSIDYWSKAGTSPFPSDCSVEPVHSSSHIIQPWLLPPQDVPSSITLIIFCSCSWVEILSPGVLVELDTSQSVTHENKILEFT